MTSFVKGHFYSYLLKGIGDLNKDSAGTPFDSKVTTETPNGLSSSRSAWAVPSTEFRDAL